MPVELSSTAKARLDALLDEYPTPGMPGTVVGVVNKEGKMLYLRSSGVKSVETGEPMLPDTIFPIFSCTKVVTGIACMQAVEQGLVELDEPVGRLVPELAEPKVVVDSTATTMELRNAETPLTLRMLLTHTSGFTYSWYNQHLRNWVLQNPNAEFSGKHLDMPLVNEPGTKWEYGISMDWAGIVLERASGMKLGEWCQKHIFEPLGLVDSAFDLAGQDELLARASVLHQWDAEMGTSQPREHARKIAEVPLHSGGGGMISTAHDFLQILAALMNGGLGPNGVRILKQDTVTAMFEDQVAGVADLGGLAVDGIVETTDKSKANDALVMLPGHPKGWGLSFLMNLEDIPGKRRAKSAEWGGIANLWWYADPTSEVAAIIFNSVLPYGMPGFIQIEGELEKTLYLPGSLVQVP
ncbi:hypothetical protein JCM24511_01415 [Saitozyma sp. JCM 24511]|nr:hypothetical protein JCM24511_01415 [Saitozyma sp. JCM 24511]